MRRRWSLLFGLGLTTVTACSAFVDSGSSRPVSPQVVGSQRQATLPRYGVFTRTFRWDSSRYANRWEQVNLTVRLTSPSGRRHRTGGFYYGPNRWKARFSPSEIGRWSWRARIADGRRRATFRGAFRVVPAGGRGFVRKSRYNRFRWTFSDGSPYYPLGIGDCLLDASPSGSPLDNWGLDGGLRRHGDHRGRVVGMRTYMRAYARAKVNLFRWSVDNCSFRLHRTIGQGGNVYLQREGRWGDELVQGLRRHGFRVYMAIFGSNPPFARGGSPLEMAAVRRYVKYVVDRYGAYVDFWELMNEARAADGWYTEVARYLRKVDPYRHPISTSFERPDLSVTDINSPHWYESESEFRSDRVTRDLIALWKKAGKRVIVGEQGNSGQNWDPRSALRMRLRAWTAFFAEGTLIFWNSSFAKDYRDRSVANIYLGPLERRYLRVLQGFATGFDRRAAMTPIGISKPELVRGSALRGPRGYAAYLHAYTNHSTPTAGVRVTIDPRAAGTAVWIDPATGRVLARKRVRAGRRVLEVPPFITDVALKVT
jgi:hypothetical protein